MLPNGREWLFTVALCLGGVWVSHPWWCGQLARNTPFPSRSPPVSHLPVPTTLVVTLGTHCQVIGPEKADQSPKAQISAEPTRGKGPEAVSQGEKEGLPLWLPGRRVRLGSAPRVHREGPHRRTGLRVDGLVCVQSSYPGRRVGTRVEEGTTKAKEGCGDSLCPSMLAAPPWGPHQKYREQKPDVGAGFGESPPRFLA